MSLVNFGGRDTFWPGNMRMKYLKKCSNFTGYLPEKLQKFRNFTGYLPEQYFSDFFLGGGGQMPPAPYCLLRLWLAYSNKQLFSSLLLVRGTVCTAAYCFVG